MSGILIYEWQPDGNGGGKWVPLVGGGGGGIGLGWLIDKIINNHGGNSRPPVPGGVPPPVVLPPPTPIPIGPDDIVIIGPPSGGGAPRPAPLPGPVGGSWKTPERAAIAAAGQIVRHSDWTKREYQCYIYNSNDQYCYTDPYAAPLGVTEWIPLAFKGPGKLVGEIHNHFSRPGYNTEGFSVRDYWRSRSMCQVGVVAACRSFLLTPAYSIKRLDWRSFPAVQELDPFTGTWK